MSPRASYGGRVPSAQGGGVVARLDAGGAAERGGLRVGDVIVSADGAELRDVIDWHWLADGPTVAVVVRSADSSERRDLVLEREAGESWGLDFADAVFDGVRTCRNRCAFCFMTQLPEGLRPALYLRDDDFRLSFLQGNFVTLTNLDHADVQRIVDQHLSPLYVSLHAVDPDVRAQLICAREDRALERLDELLDAGIDVHVQVVLVPGINDGGELDRTLTWLAQREGVLSVGIVPLGYTAHQERFSASYAEAAAAEVIRQVQMWQEAFRKRDHLTWVHLADEFYLQAGLATPPASHYDGFAQYENGIGIVRSFVDDAAKLAPRLREAASALAETARVVLLSGELSAPVVSAALVAAGVPASDERIRVVPVANAFFGGNVSVTGLLTAHDLLPAIAADPGASVFLVPDIVVNADGLLLDDVPAAELGTTSGRDVRLISCDAGGLLAALEALVAKPPPTHKE